MPDTRTDLLLKGESPSACRRMWLLDSDEDDKTPTWWGVDETVDPIKYEDQDAVDDRIYADMERVILDVGTTYPPAIDDRIYAHLERVIPEVGYHPARDGYPETAQGYSEERAIPNYPEDMFFVPPMLATVISDALYEIERRAFTLVNIQVSTRALRDLWVSSGRDPFDYNSTNMVLFGQPLTEK